MLLGCDPSQAPNDPLPTEHSQVTFAYIKHMWKSNKHDQANSALEHLVQNSLAPKAKALHDSDDVKQKEEINKLLARSGSLCIHMRVHVHVIFKACSVLVQVFVIHDRK